ncbi:MAG TPA: BadF/BadG/BcrA/BcrD ATPase family protein [Magnetospirillaceae bacterium]|jgi:glucosamine kinase
MVPAPIFCIDGGGTKSRGRLFGADGRVLAEGEDGPCNPSTNLDRALTSTLALWERCAKTAGLDPAKTGDAVLSIGAAGLYVPAAREKFLAALPNFKRVVTMSDGYAALIGAGGGKPCGLMIIGTGVAGHRLWPNGFSVQRDAWGWVAGDRGSGAWLGVKALRHMLEVVDGIQLADGLSTRVLAYFGGRAKVNDAISGIGPDRLAALAPLLLAAADDGVPRAVQTRKRAVEYLSALARVLDIGPSDALYAAGGLASIFAPMISETLGHKLATPQADAMQGCYLVAMGRAPEEKVLDETMEFVP